MLEPRYTKSFKYDVNLKKNIFNGNLSFVILQLERLQVENATEWGKRERLETEKLSLERENKKLRTELRDALDRLERHIKSQPADNELRSLQLELANKNKVLLCLIISSVGGI